VPDQTDLSDCRDGKRIHEGTYRDAAAKERTAAIEPEKKTVNNSKTMPPQRDKPSSSKKPIKKRSFSASTIIPRKKFQETTLTTKALSGTFPHGRWWA
jgi:hypothetical protein